MQKLMVSIAAVACLMCPSAYSFANEMGKMANEMTGEMKADVDAMKGKIGAMKGEMKEEMKARTDSMKAEVVRQQGRFTLLPAFRSSDSS